MPMLTTTTTMQAWNWAHQSVLALAFPFVTLNAIGRVQDRVWLLLPPALFMICSTHFESIRMSEYELSGALFVFIVVAADRYWQLLSQELVARKSGNPKLGGPGLWPHIPAHPLCARLS
jgi:hypothetical protein